jgi:hypothetical protein
VWSLACVVRFDHGVHPLPPKLDLGIRDVNRGISV